ncbi:MAG TPA: hypothetical protein ENJ95_08645 [Bacteroidetes bacterium]|nr:hypothetical protein [Bacteroidota bacterium]
MKTCLSLLCLFSCFLATSQERLGLGLENYAGVSGLSVNPAAHLSNPLSWDVNLAGAGSFFDNNYYFIKNTSALDLWKNREDIEFDFAKDLKGPPPANTYLIEFFDDGRQRYFTLDTKIAGPSFVFKIKENHSVGFFTNARIVGGALKIPNEFSYYKYDLWPLNDPFNVSPFKGAIMAWTEMGLNYAIKIPDYSGYMGIGVSLKKLDGYEAAYAENLGNWVHTKLPDDVISLRSANGKFGITDSNLVEEGFAAQKNGSGFGIDIGFVKAVQEYEDGYKWKFGAAVLDIGSIQFTKNAQAHRVHNASEFDLVLQDFERFKNVEMVDSLFLFFSGESLGSPTASLVSNHFKLALPTAIVLQADYSFTKNLYVNGLFSHRLPMGGIGPQKASLLALTPRFEHRWFSASLPVSLYNWQKVRIGFAARLGFLVIGSDHLGSLFGQSDFTGTDLYFALKINQLNLHLNLFGGGGNGNGRKHGPRKKVKCYTF